jgi:hypothetical protein
VGSDTRVSIGGPEYLRELNCRAEPGVPQPDVHKVHPSEPDDSKTQSRPWQRWIRARASNPT